MRYQFEYRCLRMTEKYAHYSYFHCIVFFIKWIVLQFFSLQFECNFFAFVWLKMFFVVHGRKYIGYGACVKLNAVCVCMIYPIVFRYVLNFCDAVEWIHCQKPSSADSRVFTRDKTQRIFICIRKTLRARLIRIFTVFCCVCHSVQYNIQFFFLLIKDF